MEVEVVVCVDEVDLARWRRVVFVLWERVSILAVGSWFGCFVRNVSKMRLGDAVEERWMEDKGE